MMKNNILRALGIILVIFLFVSCGEHGEYSEVSIGDSSGEIEQFSKAGVSEESEEVSSGRAESFFEVPFEFENLAVGKAINSIDITNGYIVEIEHKGSEGEIYSKYVGKCDNLRIIQNEKSESRSIQKDVLILDNNMFLLDKTTKTYTILESFELDGFDLLLNLNYLGTKTTKIDGVEYIVDRFVSSTNGVDVIEYYVSQGKIQYYTINDEEYKFMVSFENVDSYLKMPESYIQRSLKDVVLEYFSVPEEFSNYEIGKALSGCDVEKGFSILINKSKEHSSNEMYGYYAVYKADKAYVAYYDVVDGVSTEYTKRVLYGRGCRYELEKSVIFAENDALGSTLQLQGNFFDNYSYIGKTEKEVEGVLCSVETFCVEGKGEVSFYFDQGELCGVEILEDFILIRLTTDEYVDDSVFTLVDYYKETGDGSVSPVME